MKYCPYFECIFSDDYIEYQITGECDSLECKYYKCTMCETVTEKKCRLEANKQ